jgi:hypothetical protein
VTVHYQCSATSEAWADRLRALNNQQQRPGRVTSIVCRSAGSVSAVIIDYQHPIYGNRILTWRPEQGSAALALALTEGR